MVKKKIRNTLIIIEGSWHVYILMDYWYKLNETNEKDKVKETNENDKVRKTHKNHKLIKSSYTLEGGEVGR